MAVEHRDKNLVERPAACWTRYHLRGCRRSSRCILGLTMATPR